MAYGTGTAYAFTAAGTSGQVLTSNASGAPTWTTPTSAITITDDTTTVSTRYPLFAAVTSGTLSTEYTSSTKYQYVPSTGTLSATVFSGSGASLTNIPNGALTNSSITIGSTAVSLGGTATTIAGLTSVTSTTFVGALTGNASTATSATTATTAGNVTGTVAIANGGTGQTTASAAFNALSPITSTGDLILGTGVNSAGRLAIGANGYVLTSNGTTASWAAASGGVTQIIAGTNVTISPGGGTGAVTINASSGGASAYSRTTFTATAGQTVFTVTYAVGYLQIYVNGVLLTGSDYTATSGTDFTLGVACAVGDIVEALVITTSVTGVTTGKAIAMAMIFGY